MSSHNPSHKPLIKLLCREIFNKSRCAQNTHCSSPATHVQYHHRRHNRTDALFLQELTACYLYLPSANGTEFSELELEKLVRAVLNQKYGWAEQRPVAPSLLKEIAEWKDGFDRVGSRDLRRLLGWMRSTDNRWYRDVKERRGFWTGVVREMQDEYLGGVMVGSPAGGDRYSVEEPDDVKTQNFVYK